MNPEVYPVPRVSRPPWVRWLPWVLILFGFLWGLGQAPLFDEDEGAFSEATQEMVTSGDYLTTRVNGVLRFDKPILTYWLQAASAYLFGFNEWAMRLPSALASIGWMLAIYGFARRRLDATTARIAVIIAACSLQITIIGKAAIADALLNAFLAIAMFCLYESLTTARRRYAFGFWVAAALGFLTKGPIALLIPGAVGAIYPLRWRTWKGLGTLLYPPALLLFGLIALPWYWLEYEEQGQAFIDGFFMHHNVERFKNPFEGHAGSWLYYLPVGLVGLMPFTPLAIQVLRRVRSYGQTPLGFYLLSWFLFVFAFFSLSGTKLPHYLIYGYTPLALLAAREWQARPRAALQWPFWVLWTVLLVVPPLVPRLLPLVADPFAVEIMRSVPDYFGWGYFVAMGLIGFFVYAGFRWVGADERRLAVLGGAMLLLINSVWMPRLGGLLQSPVREAAQLSRQRGYSVVMWKHYWPSFLFYAHRFVDRRDPVAGEVVLTKKNILPTLKGYQTLYDKNGIVLIRLSENGSLSRR